MKARKTIIILLLLSLTLRSIFSGKLKKNSEGKNSAENLKNKNNDKSSDKLALATNSETTVELQTSTKLTTESTKPLVQNHNLKKEKTEEEMYELERQNAMAEFIF
jgi:hypothetical protein